MYAPAHLEFQNTTLELVIQGVGWLFQGINETTDEKTGLDMEDVRVTVTTMLENEIFGAARGRLILDARIVIKADITPL